MPYRPGCAAASPAKPPSTLLILLALLLSSGSAALSAQTVAQTISIAGATPAEPGPQQPHHPAAPASASLSGSVSDGSGALIPGALLLLRSKDGSFERSAPSDAEGRFIFPGLPPGTYTLTLSAPGFEGSVVPDLRLTPGENRDLPRLDLAIPVNHADVVVNLTSEELATEELHAEEHQRILGFPDFYTSYASNPEPLDARQKFSLAVHATTDRMSFAGAALIAGGEQLQNTFPSYGHGFRGYAKRYGAAYTDAFVGKFIGSALLPTLFRQDPRYFYDGTGSYKHRALHAILSAVLARGDNGRIEPNYSHVLGNAAAGAISTLYHPATDSAGKLALDNALLGTLGEAGVNLTREFLLRHLTRGVPTAAP